MKIWKIAKATCVVEVDRGDDAHLFCCREDVSFATCVLVWRDRDARLEQGRLRAVSLGHWTRKKESQRLSQGYGRVESILVEKCKCT